MNTNITELAAQMRGLAAAATPGHWNARSDGVPEIGNVRNFVETEALYKHELLEEMLPKVIAYGELSEDDAKFIAAANPRAIVTILDALEAAQAELEEWRFTNKIDELQRAHDAALARLAEIERQEPVGFVESSVRGAGGFHACVNQGVFVPAGTKLFAAAGASPVQPNEPVQLDTRHMHILATYENRFANPAQPSQAGELSEAVQNLIDATEGLMAWQVKNVHVWHNVAYDTASMRVEQLRAAINAKGAV